MIVLLLGATGQLGSALQAAKPPDVELITRCRSDADLQNKGDVERLISAVSADLIINAAAYTAVDKAEVEEDAARRVNVEAVAAIAAAAQSRHTRLIHISTDYVFDGSKGSPYLPDDPASPINVYGRTKLEGEREALTANRDCLVVRTAWLYAEEGSNFVRTMLRLMSSRPQLRVISDQIGTPTYAGSLAEALWSLARIDHRGILHYTDSGVASWYDFACAIQEEALALGLLQNAAQIIPISTSEYPTPAKRPTFSILDKSQTWSLLGKPANHWRVNLRSMLKRVSNV